MMDDISLLFMMDEIPQGEITAVEDVSVPEMARGEITVEDVSVLEKALGPEITEVEDVPVPETSKVVDPRSTDLIHTLNRMNKLLEALLPAEVTPSKAKEGEKARESAGGSDVKVAHCSCHIDSAVVKEWKSSIRYNRMKLLELLKKYPCLLAIHGSCGDTVLHAAARDGNLKLLAYTCSLFLNSSGNAINEYVHGANRIDRKAFFEKENDDQFTAKDSLWFTMAGTTMYACFDNLVKSGKFDTWNKINIGNATQMAAMQDEVFEPFYEDDPPLKTRLAHYADGTYIKDNRGVDAKRQMKEVIIQEYNERKEELDGDPPTDKDLIAEYEELRFLLTLSGSRVKVVEEEYLRAVIKGCVKKGPDVVKYLFSHRNVKGQTAFHCANVRYWQMLIEEIPAGEEYKDCFNARDVRGWTALQCAIAEGKGVGFVKGQEVGAASAKGKEVDASVKGKEVGAIGEGKDIGASSRGKEVGASGTIAQVKVVSAIAKGNEIECLLKDPRVDVNSAMPKEYSYSSKSKGNGVALHLAIMHNRVKVVCMLLQRKDTNVNALYVNRIKDNIGCNIQDSNLGLWTPLQLAVLFGRHEIITALLNHPKVEDPGVQKGKFLWPIGARLCQNAHEEKSNSNEKPPSMLSAIHLAGIMGDPKTLRCFLNISKFDLSVTIQGCSALHFVVDGTPLKFRISEELLRKSHFYSQREYGKYLKACKNMQKNVSDKDREACISILIQGGLDVWQKNNDNKFPTPGPNTSHDVRHFWQQKLLSETQDAKNNLNDAGNAVSIVSALVATASYVGPLQPPLGLDSNFIQDQSLPVRIYMVTNTISFYLAVASIMFAVVPSLPMPQEGLYEEWQRSQKTIIIAIHLLLAAVLNILISFGAASNVVVSLEYSWQHKGLVFYPTLLGGSLCIVAICLFYLRLFRLAHVKNLTIKCIYHRVYKAA